MFSLNSTFAYNVIENGTVKGSVYNPIDNSAVKLANISLMNVVNNTVNEVITNDKGEFVIRDIPFGEYVLTTKMDGFEINTIYNVVLMKEKPLAEVSRIELNKSIVLQKGVVMGSVFDSTNNNVLQYAAITIYNCLDDQLMGIGVTDDKGDFEINNLPFGEYCIKVSSAGFENKKIYNVVLMRENPIVKLDEIELAQEKFNDQLSVMF